jgi:hypothetical protein
VFTDKQKWADVHFSKHEASTPVARVMSFAADMNDRGVLDFPKADTRELPLGVNKRLPVE